MKKNLTFISFLISLISYGQSPEVNLIITINDKIVTKGINNPINIYFSSKGDKVDSIKAIYSPGALKLDSSDYKKIRNLTFDRIELIFAYTRFEGDGTRKNFTYITPLFNNWSKAGFIILKFYDLSIPKYKKIFVSKAKYVSEMESDMVSSSGLKWK